MPDTATFQDMAKFAWQIRMEVMKMMSYVPVGHMGGSLSVAEVLSVLYNGAMKIDPANPRWEGRDWLVMSKGHCGPALYATLAMKGFFPMEELKTLNKPGTNLPSHCDRNRTIGIDMTTGSLGQGSSLAAGVATGFKMDKTDNRVFLIMGDGEINEGQVWEMALYASTRHLDNLIAFVDFNKLQIDGRTDTDDICNLGDIRAKFEAFGWYAQKVDGHDVKAIYEAVENARAHTGSPSMIVLDTVKGYGWSKSAGQVGSHSRGVTPEELEEALAEMKESMDKAAEV